MSAKEVLETYARSSCMLPSLCVFSWIIVRKLILFNFSNINVESMWVQYPELNEDVKLLGSSTVPWWGYADDLILLMLDISSLQRATIILDEVFTNYGLCINVSKSETMVLKHMLLDDEHPDTIISLRIVPLQNSTEVKYLGSYIS